MNSFNDELKMQAVEYYKKNQVPEKLESILNDMFFENPKDIYGRLSKYFESLALNPVITSLQCKSVLSSSGEPALKCNVFATVKNHSKLLSFVQVSIANEMLKLHMQANPENAELPTQEEIVQKSCSNIANEISSNLQGIPLLDQREVDKILSEWIDRAQAEILIHKVDNYDDDEALQRTPTPSSGKKKKASGKGKGKSPDKPVPPHEPLPPQLQGCSSALAASLGVLKASSDFLERPAFEHLYQTMIGEGIYGKVADENTDITLPTVAMTVLSGGKNAPGKLNLVKNVFVIAKPGLSIRESIKILGDIYRYLGKSLTTKGGAHVSTGPLGTYVPAYDKLEQPLDVVIEAISSCGLSPGQDVFIGLECNANEVFDYDKGKYDVITGTLKSADEMVDFYRDILGRYQAVVMLIDPLRKEDREQWPKLCEVISEKCFVIGGELIYGSLHSLRNENLMVRPSSGIALCNGGGITCSDLYRIVGDVRATDGVTVMTSSPGDACDDVFSDLAVGLGVDIVLLGSPVGGENILRLNRLVDIEEFIENDQKLKLKYREQFSFPIIKPPPPPEPRSDEEPEAKSTTPDNKSKKK